MDWVAFGLLLNEHILLYLLMLIGSIVLYVVLFKKMYISILDPFIYSLVFSCFGFSVVWFLYFTDSITIRYLLSYLFTQIAFWLGLFSFKTLTKKQIIKDRKTIVIEHETLILQILFFTTSIIYIGLQLLSYVVIGIPLLLGSHIDIYSNSGGWGIIGHFIEVLKPISIFLLIYYLFKKNSSYFIFIYKYTFLALVLLFFALSASKGEFMSIGLIFFCFLLLNAPKYKDYFLNLKKIEIRLILAGLVFVFFTIIIQSRLVDDDSSSLGVFLFRLVAAGDTYYFSYPNANIETLNSSKPFLALFGNIFSTLRIIPHEDQPVILGVQLFRLFGETDLTAGPNARHNVFGYVYFGFYGSIAFSYLIGVTFSFLRNKLFFNFKKNVIGQIIFMLLYLQLVSLETDPPMAISNTENLLLVLPILAAITAFCYSLLMNFNPEKAEKSV